MSDLACMQGSEIRLHVFQMRKLRFGEVMYKIIWVQSGCDHQANLKDPGFGSPRWLHVSTILPGSCNFIQVEFKYHTISTCVFIRNGLEFSFPSKVPRYFNIYAGDLGPIPGLGRSLGEGHGNQLQHSCLESPTDREAWPSTVYVVTKSWTWLHD